jgi:hypothetical protein
VEAERVMEVLEKEKGKSMESKEKARWGSK